MSNDKTTKYGIFYKSHGKWIGPYAGILTTKKNVTKYSNLVRGSLKSKIVVRKVN